MQETRLTYLFEKYLNKTCTPKEREELAFFILNSKDNSKIMELLEHEWNQTSSDIDISEEKAKSIIDLIISSPASIEIQNNQILSAPVHQIRWWRYAAASVIMIIVAGYFLFTSKTIQQPAIAKSPIVPYDIAPPKSSKAFITLANGKQILVDSLGTGKLGMQGNVNIIKLSNGQIAYNSSIPGLPQEISYNTLTNPRGSKVISLTLVDNSKVWLNAESSLRYPTGFTGKERTVELTGEAYFEIAKNQNMPFKVKVNEETDIQVLGTHFNINCYKNEANINTTLLEGSVQIISNGEKAVIKPGQQAQTVNQLQHKIKIVNDVDVEKVIAWKNGVFNFEDARLEDVMRQLERWYDIDVVYEKGIPQLEFMGKMSKNLRLSEVLRGLELSKVRFREEGRKLVVLP